MSNKSTIYQRERMHKAERVVEVGVGRARVYPESRERRREEERDHQHTGEQHRASHVWRDR